MTPSPVAKRRSGAHADARQRRCDLVGILIGFGPLPRVRDELLELVAGLALVGDPELPVSVVDEQKLVGRTLSVAELPTVDRLRKAVPGSFVCMPKRAVQEVELQPEHDDERDPDRHGRTQLVGAEDPCRDEDGERESQRPRGHEPGLEILGHGSTVARAAQKPPSPSARKRTPIKIPSTTRITVSWRPIQARMRRSVAIRTRRHGEIDRERDRDPDRADRCEDRDVACRRGRARVRLREGERGARAKAQRPSGWRRRVRLRDRPSARE